MKLLFFFLLSLQYFPLHSHFIEKHYKWQRYFSDPEVVSIASTGRSGSTMLSYRVDEVIGKEKVLKMHLLPPDNRYKGKILFIYSNPDQAAESALHHCYTHKFFAKNHFIYVETTDKNWLLKLGSPPKQTVEYNLLAQDALGTEAHIRGWLHNYTRPSTLGEAQVLALKYENLWDEETVCAIRDFLERPNFSLPPRKPRGYAEGELFPDEILFRKTYNLSTPENPIYAAYDRARELWENAPPFQFLSLLDHKE